MEDISFSIMEEPTPPDYYADLGLSPESSVSEIKKAFRRLAKVYHPDKQKHEKCTDAKDFRKVSSLQSHLILL